MGAGVTREDIKRQVYEATDLVALIGEHVGLRARGKEFVGLCPFHDDKSPSLNVNPVKRIYKCFACGAGGDAFTFVMEYHKMSFPEALSHLAERADIKIPRFHAAGDADEASPRQRILQVNSQAQGYFRKAYRDADTGRVARDYVAQRSISAEMVELFQVGAAPDAWDALAREALRARWDLPALELAGLIARRDGREGHYDRLRHRLIFPILDNLGRPIAFGGRLLPGTKREDSADAKYLNSPETPAFNKSGTLFGLHAAQKPIIDARTAIIVEGYIDVIACHQAGVRNAVATLGTALTAEHAKLLRRYCDKVVLVFDGDEAGQKAADRALNVFFTEPIDIAIAVLPDGRDPGDLLLQPGGREAWDAALDAACDAMTFQFARVRELFKASDTLAGRQRIAEEYLRTLMQLGIGSLERQRYGLVFAQVAQLLGMSPGLVGDMLHKLAPSRRREQAADDAPAPPPDKRTQAERHLVGALLNAPDEFDAPLGDGRPLSESLVTEDFQDAGARGVFHALSAWLMDHGALNDADFRNAFTDEQELALARDLQARAARLTGCDPAALSSQVVHNARAIVEERAEREYQACKQEMKERSEAAADAGPDDAMHRLTAVRERLNAHPTPRRVPRVVGRP